MRARGPLAAIVVVCVVAAAAAIRAAPTSAATVERDDVDSADVSFLAGAGEANRVVVRAEPGGIRFTDAGASISSASCLRVAPNEVFCAGIAETLIVEAGDGDDTIDVSAAPTALAAGGDGDDLVVGALLSGGPGDDELRGIAAAGRLHGGAGDDRLVAGPLGGELAGGAGNDMLVGGDGRDVLTGGEADCAGCSAPARDDDVVRGGPGKDVVRVGGGRDRLDGGTGDDAYVVRAGVSGVAATIADGGGVRDTISLACTRVRLTVSAGLRDRTGRYVLPAGTIAFAGLDGVLPCSTTAVPRVVGLPLAAARRALLAAGLRVGRITYRRSTGVPRGRVLAQRPAGRAPVGSAVALVVSSGR